MRCFVAIRFPDQVNEQLGRVIEELRRAGADIRWVPEANLHLTLKFLGEVSDSEIAPVHEALRQVSGEPLCLTVTGLGSFPPQRRPKIIWAGLEGDTDRLRALQADVEQGMAALGYAPENRAFHAHLTIGRVKSWRHHGALLQAMERRSTKLATASVEVDSFALYESCRTPKGPEYQVLSSYPLR